MKASQTSASSPRRPEGAGNPTAPGRSQADASCGTASAWDPQLDGMGFVDRWNFRLLV